MSDDRTPEARIARLRDDAATLLSCADTTTIPVRLGDLRAVLAAIATAESERDEARADRRCATAEIAALVDCGGVACTRPDGCALHLTRERDEALDKLRVCEEHCALAEREASAERAAHARTVREWATAEREEESTGYEARAAKLDTQADRIERGEHRRAT